MKIRTHHQKAALLLKGAVLVALLAITATSTSCTDPRKARMDEWRGHPIDELIQHWGAPSSSVKLSDGRTVYTWIAVYGSGRTYRSTFTTSKDGIIEDWAYHDASIPGRPE
jgi:hypothetical protein